MALEDKFSQHDAQVVDKYERPTAAYVMSTRDYVVRPDATAGAMIVTLPPVAEAKGRFYSIIAHYADNTNTITITAVGSEVWPVDVVLNEKGRGELFYSDGLKWVMRSFGDITHSTLLTAGAVNLRFVHLTNSADNPAGNHVAFESIIESEFRTGAWANAIYGKIDYGTLGSAHGLAAAICAEVIPPNSSLARGGLYALDLEFGCQALSSWGSAGPVAFMRFSNYGTQAYFDDNAYFFNLDRVLEGAGHMLSLNAHTLKCQINGLVALKERYVVLSEAENILDHNTNVVTGSYGMRIRGTLDAGASDGVAAYFEGHTTLQTGLCYAVGVWMNVDSAPAGGAVRALDVGVYTDVDMSLASVYGMNIGIHLGAAGAPIGAFQMRFNHSGHALTSWFRASNPGAVVYADNVDHATSATDKIGAIRISITGSGADPGYIYIYSSAGA